MNGNRRRVGGMPDDPKQIANDLIGEQDLNDALARAMTESATAHQERDNYTLSVFVTVKGESQDSDSRGFAYFGALG